MNVANEAQELLNHAHGETPSRRQSECKGTIWIDVDNSPHVPFFAPIIDELEKRDYSVVVTARDCFQVRELADLLHLKYQLIGRHSGKNTIRKVGGLILRAVQLAPGVLRRKPDLALSVCSRSQLIVSHLMGIPTMFMGDYEFAKGWVFVRPTWLLCPEVIPDSAIRMNPRSVFKYPGIKEDVYVPRFVPEPGVRRQLGLQDNEVVATIRPPAREAHYYTPESDRLFDATVEILGRRDDVRMIVLPRTEKQSLELMKRWPELFLNGKMRIPDQVVNGLNLIWYSDLVVSGGGTMNREAAALGVPVYSVFRGAIGAVDRYLASRGRLVLVESVEDIQRKVAIVRRNRPARPERRTEEILQYVVRHITGVMDSRCASQKNARA